VNSLRSSGLFLIAVALTISAAAAAPAQVSQGATMSLAGAIASQMVMCWNPPGKSHDIVVLTVHLNRDGTLAQPPQLDLTGADATLPSAEATASAMRAVEHCAPYKLPADLYERWRNQTVRFDPSYMLPDQK